MGLGQRGQPQRRKELVGPVLMIRAASSSPAFASFAQDASQPPAHVAVHCRESGFVAVFEVFEPAPQLGVQYRDDLPQAFAAFTRGAGPHRIFELRPAFVPRELLPSVEAIAEALA